MSNIKSYENYKLEVIHKPRLKHTYLSISREGVLSIKTPFKSETFIQNVLQEKSSWIQKQLEKLQNKKQLSLSSLYSEAFITQRVEYFAKKMQLTYTKLQFRKMKSRWGSCNSRGEIVLNSELTKVAAPLIDYVVVHELAHLIHMNHSKAFHSLVQNYLPEAKESRKELKQIHLT